MLYLVVCSSPGCKCEIQLSSDKTILPTRRSATCFECGSRMISTCSVCGFLLLRIEPSTTPKCDVCSSDLEKTFRAKAEAALKGFVFVSGPTNASAPSPDLRQEYPFPASLDAVDPLCLEQACRGVLTDLHGTVQQWAEHYMVPVDILEKIVLDRQFAALSGTDPTPARLFVRPEAEVNPG